MMKIDKRILEIEQTQEELRLWLCTHKVGSLNYALILGNYNLIQANLKILRANQVMLANPEYLN